MADKGLSVAECLGAETLLQLLKNYARSADRKTAITVGGPRAECGGVQGTASWLGLVRASLGKVSGADVIAEK